MGRIKGYSGCPETMPLDTEKRLNEGIYFQDDINWLITQYEKMVDSCAAGKRQLENLNLQNNAVLVTQNLKITADYLLTTNVTNDTLITTGSPVPFRWNISVFPHSVSVGFGESVEPWVKLNDLAHNNAAFHKVWDGSAWTDEERSGICMSVYQKPTYLQCFDWDGHILKPKAWVIGQTVQLLQIVTDKVTLP